MAIWTKSAILEFGKSGLNGNALIEGQRFSGVLGIPNATTGDSSMAQFASTQGGVAFDPAGMASGGMQCVVTLSVGGDNFALAVGGTVTATYSAIIGSSGGQTSGPFTVGTRISELWTRIA